MSKQKVNLTLLKKLVGELEKSLAAADALADSVGETTTVEYITEMARASGLAGIITQEDSMLIKDIYTLIRLSQGPTSSSESDVMAELDKILGPAPKRSSN
jgi:hypothetical protein